MWFLRLALLRYLWEGDDRLWCRAIIHHFSFLLILLFLSRKFAEIDFGFCAVRCLAQNNFHKISETSCLPQKISIYRSFVLRTTFFNRIFYCLYIFQHVVYLWWGVFLFDFFSGVRTLNGGGKKFNFEGWKKQNRLF